MSMISIVGPIDDYDEAISKYVIGKNIHLENALHVLKSNKNLSPFDDKNPYHDVYTKLSALVETYNLPQDTGTPCTFDIKSIETLLKSVSEEQESYRQELETLHAAYDENTRIINQLKPLYDVDIDLSEIFNFKFIDFRFGKLPKSSYVKLETFLDELEAVFVKGTEDRDYVWGAYFTPSPFANKVDKIFASLYFERTRISGKAKGTPRQATERLEAENEALTAKIIETEANIAKIVKQYQPQIVFYHQKLKKIQTAFEHRKYGAKVGKSFYIIVGWTDAKTLRELKRDLSPETEIALVTEEPDEVSSIITPPTKLKNNPLVRPFEFFVKMYGLPAYNEIDPTPLVALSYILMFGIMFADVGQGLVLAIAGFLIYRLKKIDLAAIISLAGLSSTVFGFCFGSVFGLEDVIPPLIFHPMDHITTILLSTVALGTVIITIAILYNIINAIRNKNWGKALFEQNGFAGLIFYWAVIIGVTLLFLKGLNPFTVVYNIIFIIIPLLLIFLREPLTRLIQKKKHLIKGSKGAFFLENFFELFEILLSFVTNTISFVRIGAFALNHVGMMGVVLIFANMAAGGAGTVVLVIGNLVVMALEGLIVGIQVLRLEFYEIFSRFYQGNGKAFHCVAEAEKEQ